MRGKLSCERCGSNEVRRHPKHHWNDDGPRWMCRSCIISFELIEHVKHRMRFEQHCARHYPHLPRRHSSDNIKDNLAAARSRASKRRLPATLMMDGWRRITAFFEESCAYCGDKWEEVEHTPLCHGGGTTIANCLPACVGCNGKKHQHTLEKLLAMDLWPHRTDRLKRALSWLQLHGRTTANPSGRPSQLSLEVQTLIDLRKREHDDVKPWSWLGPNVWFGVEENIVTALARRNLISAVPFDYRGKFLPCRMEGPCWQIHLTETGQKIEILELGLTSQASVCSKQGVSRVRAIFVEEHSS